MLTVVELKYLRIFRTYIWNSLKLSGVLHVDHGITEFTSIKDAIVNKYH